MHRTFFLSLFVSLILGSLALGQDKPPSEKPTKPPHLQKLHDRQQQLTEVYGLARATLVLDAFRLDADSAPAASEKAARARASIAALDRAKIDQDFTELLKLLAKPEKLTAAELDMATKLSGELTKKLEAVAENKEVAELTVDRKQLQAIRIEVARYRAGKDLRAVQTLENDLMGSLEEFLRRMPEVDERYKKLLTGLEKRELSLKQAAVECRRIRENLEYGRSDLTIAWVCSQSVGQRLTELGFDKRSIERQQKESADVLQKWSLTEYPALLTAVDKIWADLYDQQQPDAALLKEIPKRLSEFRGGVEKMLAKEAAQPPVPPRLLKLAEEQKRDITAALLQ